jgi:hypothetical protein
LSKSSDSCLSNSQPNKFDTAGYESDQDEDDKLSDEEESLQHLGFEEEFRQLYLSDNFLSKSTCDRFLKLMKKYQVDGKLDISEVPGDMRTLIKCSEKIMVKEQYGGKTMYLGIKRFIQMLLKKSSVHNLFHFQHFQSLVPQTKPSVHILLPQDT